MPRNTESTRRQRYARVLEPIQTLDEFSALEVREKCENETLRFISGLLGQLARDGVLKVAESDGGAKFQWALARQSFDQYAWIDRQICGTQLTQTPLSERPRERLLRLGADKLRAAELLAILIRSGRRGESALEAGERIANRAGEDLHMLRALSPSEMKKLSLVVSETAYCQIMAGIELGRRVSECLNRQSNLVPRIDSSSVAVQYCSRLFARLAIDRQQEEFHIVTLDTKLQPIANHQITIGTLDASLVSPREVFKPAIRDSAAAILLVHNHPSGDPTPSRQDYQVTDTLTEVGKILGIRVIDHIVVASSRSLSISDCRLSQ